jgi:general secretion pathway protein D
LHSTQLAVVRRLAARTFAAALLLGALSCTSYRIQREAQLAEGREDWDEAVVKYMQLIEQEPGNVRTRSALVRAKIRASQEHFNAGRRFAEAGVLDRALIELQQAVALDPTNQYAQVELDKVRTELDKSRGGAAEPISTLDEMKKKTRDIAAQPPVLNPRSTAPISLEFPKAVSIFDIYRALGKAFGINVLFDPALKDQELAIELRDVTAQTALETLMRAAGHFYKVIDEHSILIAADTPQNRKNYEDLVIQTFFLSNAEVKDVLTLLRSLIGAKNVATNEQLNAVTIRDTADKVKVAQRIIEGIDKSRSEVVVDVELIEVNTTKLRQLGVSLSEYQVTQSIDLGEDAPIRLSDLRNLTSESWVLSIPSIIYDFVKANSDAQLLAKPQVRISEGEKGKIHIGDRVPIPVTSFNTSNTVGGGTIVPITSFQYQDVGIKLDLEPRVHHNKEITLKLQVEISQISGYADAGSGQRQPIIGTRTIESTIRLKDGETNFLAGLIRTDETVGESGIPGLSDIPIIGRLFGRTTTDIKRTDVMLTLTPHIVRTPDVTEGDLLPIWVGTESNITFRGGSPRVESDAEGPFEEGAADAAAEEKIREQVQRLPRGLREEGRPGVGPSVGPATTTPQQGPGGVNLAPGSAPSNPFAPPAKPEPPPDEEPPGGGQAALGGETPDLAAIEAAAIASMETPSLVELALVPETGAAGLAQRVVVDLMVQTTTAVAHLPATITFDPSRLFIEAVEPGTFLGGMDASQVVADTSTPGQIVLGASRMGDRPGVAGRGVVARLHFRTLAPGPAVVSITAVRAMDKSLDEIASEVRAAAQIEISQPGTALVPRFLEEPATAP